MNAIRKEKFTAPTTSAYAIELRQRVERLEYLRVHACRRREREAVELIDRQIKHAIGEWMESLADKVEARLTKVG